MGGCSGLRGGVEELGWTFELLPSGAVWEPADEVIACASWNYRRGVCVCVRPVQEEVDLLGSPV